MLLVDQQFRIADDVDEKDMRDLKLHFLFNLGRHSAKLRQNKAIDNIRCLSTVEIKAVLRGMIADRAEQLAHLSSNPSILS